MLIAKAYGNSDKGLIRTNNEDAFIVQTIWDTNHWLLVVIDGLGGYEGGEVAASIAKETILHSVEEMKGRDCLDAIMQSVTDANNAIFNQRNNKEGLGDMGCVVTAAILDLEKRQLNVAHVGDTRLYQLDSNGLSKLTHDHSFVGTLEDEGRISEDDAMNHPRRNLIDRTVGDDLKDIDTPKFIEAAVFPVFKGNQYLLCSDGLSDMITSAEIDSILQKKTNLKNKVNHLINSANNKGGKDNITVIVANIIHKEYPNNVVCKNPAKSKKSKIKRRNKHKNEKLLSIQTQNESKTFEILYKVGAIALIIVVIFLALILLSRSVL